jgi:hypothetical protein
MAKPIKGTDGDDLMLVGTAGNDHIQGRDGNDTITGGAGNDDIDGGKGIDTAVYSGNFADYSVSFRDHGNDNLTVTDNRAGSPDGTDSLHHVEFLKFNDAIFDVQSDVTHRADASIGGNEIQGPGQPHPTDPWWGGGGNSLLHYNIADLNDQNIELGLKFHVRDGADITKTSVDADGTVHYSATAGNEDLTHTLVNFDYVVNTGLNGSSSTLADFDFKMVVEQTQGATTKTAVFDFDAGTHSWVLEGNPTVGYGGADDFRAGTTPSATVVSQVAENSENFSFIKNAFGETTSQMSLAGTQYSMTLEALDNGHILGSVHNVLLLT